MLSKLHALAFLLIGMIFITPAVAGMAELEIIDSKVYHAPNYSLEINVSIVHDEFVSRGSELRVYLNDIPKETIDLRNYLHDESYYSYKSHPFSYNITAKGENEWEEYPDVDFSYAMKASGYNGTECDNYWVSDYFYYDSRVNAKEGLEFIRDGSKTIILPPGNCPEKTTWSAQTSEANVEVTMRKVCGGNKYDAFVTDENGWIYRQLRIDEECTGIPATTDRECWIHIFDNESLKENFRAYGGPTGFDHGGIYKNNIYQKWEFGQVKWDGNKNALGYIRINNYDYESTYFIVYLPPNGPMVCAYTSYAEPNSSQWSRSKTISESAKYGQPYQRQWTEQELDLVLKFPDCPCTDCNCNRIINQYLAKEYQDPDDAITLAFDEPSLTVTGVCNIMGFTKNYTETVSLADYMKAGNPDSYNLSVKLIEDGNKLAEKSHQFFVCEDLDGDGYCEEIGDCDDLDPSINPDTQEICDYKDNDCDGGIDEGFYGEGFVCKLGEPCNAWEGSVCNGTCECTQDGLNVTCNSTYYPGELDEVCLNELDDDCDGENDEVYEDGREGCVFKCEEGKKKPCGSDIGFCTPGWRECINGSWGLCREARLPREETCNLALNELPRYADDNCDGIIDNVLNRSSIEETKCQCFDGNPPKPEVCNGIDDDCDNEIDERACACSEGDSQYCGNDKGICEQGIQYCVDGYWETECHGGLGPDPKGDICYNDLDDDCDGENDEGCVITITCKNNELDLNEEGVDCGGECPNPCEYPIPWIIFSIVVIAFIIIFMILEIKGKIPM